jgi:hypothetical protein
MKKTFNLVFSATLFVALGIFVALAIGFDSCAPTTNAQDTTTLLSTPSNLALTADTAMASSSISLSCGCPFGPLDINSGPLMIVGYGDTSVIKFSFARSIDSLAYFHTLNAAISFADTSKSPGSSSSWIALYFLDQGQFPLYDTIRVTANY